MLSTVLSTENRGWARPFGAFSHARTRFCGRFDDFSDRLSLFAVEAYLFLRGSRGFRHMLAYPNLRACRFRRFHGACYRWLFAESERTLRTVCIGPTRTRFCVAARKRHIAADHQACCLRRMNPELSSLKPGRGETVWQCLAARRSSGRTCFCG